jgi:hypothetical protein
MQVDTKKPTVEDAFTIMAALARAVSPLGDASLNQLTAQIGARVARLNLDSDPDDVRAIVDMADALDAALARFAKAIHAEDADVAA